MLIESSINKENLRNMWEGKKLIFCKIHFISPFDGGKNNLSNDITMFQEIIKNCPKIGVKSNF